MKRWWEAMPWWSWARKSKSATLVGFAYIVACGGFLAWAVAHG